jgi:hypothetical protein
LNGLEKPLVEKKNTECRLGEKFRNVIRPNTRTLASWLWNKLSVILELHKEHEADTKSLHITTIRHA